MISDDTFFRYGTLLYDLYVKWRVVRCRDSFLRFCRVYSTLAKGTGEVHRPRFLEGPYTLLPLWN